MKKSELKLLIEEVINEDKEIQQDWVKKELKELHRDISFVLQHMLKMKSKGRYLNTEKVVIDNIMNYGFKILAQIPKEVIK